MTGSYFHPNEQSIVPSGLQHVCQVGALRRKAPLQKLPCNCSPFSFCADIVRFLLSSNVLDAGINFPSAVTTIVPSLYIAPFLSNVKEWTWPEESRTSR